jgi:hypothetical protein
VHEKIGEREDATGEPLSAAEQNELFQDVVSGGSGSGYLPGHGYMAKLAKSDEDLIEKLKEQKETNDRLIVLVEELQEKNNRLETLFEEERAARAREMGSIGENIREKVREELLSAFGRRI